MLTHTVMQKLTSVRWTQLVRYEDTDVVTHVYCNTRTYTYVQEIFCHPVFYICAVLVGKCVNILFPWASCPQYLATVDLVNHCCIPQSISAVQVHLPW